MCCFICIGADEVEFEPIGLKRRHECFLIPPIACRKAGFQSALKRFCDPMWFTPAKQVNRNIRVDAFGIRSEPESGTTGDICRFLGGTFGAGFRAGGGIDICAQFDLQMRQPGAVSRQKEQPEKFLIDIRMLHSVIHQEP